CVSASVMSSHVPICIFFFYCYRTLRPLHSFPTRRSSDLVRLFAADVASAAPEITAALVRVEVVEHEFPSARHDLRVALHRLELADRKSTRLNSSHVSISYAVFCLKKKNSV